MKQTFCVISVFVFAILAHTGFSQNPKFREGYLVTAEGDTLRGFVRKQLGVRPYEGCDFVKNKKEEPLHFAAAAVKVVKPNDRPVMIPRSVTIDKDPETVLLEILVAGRLTLYKYIRFSTAYFFIEKLGKMEKLTNPLVDETIGGDAMRVRSNYYRGQLRQAFSDCPSMSLEQVNISLHESGVTKLVTKYNACMDAVPEKK